MTKNLNDLEIQDIMKGIMSEMQKDFLNTEWWLDDKKDKLPLILGIWEFKDSAQELGFQIGIT